MNIRKIFFSLVLVAAATLCHAQHKSVHHKHPAVSALQNKPLFNTAIDTIYYKKSSLKTFFQKMKEMKEGKRKNVVIVQLGDSHLQADFFSGIIRQRLQQDYGNGGRGLIFPYRVAGSNEPNSYRSSSTGLWEARRCVMLNPSDIPIGVSGYGLRTCDSSASLKIIVKNGDSLNYGFTTMKFFHDVGPDCYDWIIYTSRNSRDSVVVAGYAPQYGSVMDSVAFKDTMHVVNMRINSANTGRNKATIFGMVLGNNQPGIIYNTIGANGARYEDYNHSEFFIQQLAALHPDLVIVSLGTNEAYARDYNSDQFETQMDTLLNNIRRAVPGVDFLLTTPNDSYRGHRYKNPDVAKATAAIEHEAIKHNAAYWDFYHIMGGFGSIQRWYLKHLAQKDRVHFTVGGYTIQAKLFYEALQKTIQNGLEKLAP